MVVFVKCLSSFLMLLQPGTANYYFMNVVLKLDLTWSNAHAVSFAFDSSVCQVKWISSYRSIHIMQLI